MNRVAGGRTRGQQVAAAGHLAAALAREPRQLGGLPAWWRSRSAPTGEPGRPWWPPGALAAVERHLRPESTVFEYGGGGSTRWLAGIVAQVTTVEHERGWFDQIAADLPPNVTLLLREPEPSGSVRSVVAPGGFDSYVATIGGYPDGSFDLVIIDGRARVECGRAALSKVRAGGLLVLDDSQRPRYAPLLHDLHGWPRVDVRGLKPREVEISQTTIWTRPA